MPRRSALSPCEITFVPSQHLSRGPNPGAGPKALAYKTNIIAIIAHLAEIAASLERRITASRP